MKTYHSVKFQTLSLPCFNKYRELFYNSDGIKIVPNNLESLLTEKGLAYWLMDDSYKSENGIYICSESFTNKENKILVSILKNKFGLNCSIHNTTNGDRIYIFSDSKTQLIKLIKPYLLPHFYYKLDLTEDSK